MSKGRWWGSESSKVPDGYPASEAALAPVLAAIAENDAIVRELAESDPYIAMGSGRDDEWRQCRHCGGKCPLWRDDGHEPSCVWRRANALYPPPVVPTAALTLTDPAPRYTGEMGRPPGDDHLREHDTPAHRIAYRWARAAFNLAHFSDSDPDAALLKERVRAYWAPMDYTGDEDEIIRVAILEAVKEIEEQRRE